MLINMQAAGSAPLAGSPDWGNSDIKSSAAAGQHTLCQRTTRGVQGAGWDMHGNQPCTIK